MRIKGRNNIVGFFSPLNDTSRWDISPFRLIYNTSIGNYENSRRRCPRVKRHRRRFKENEYTRVRRQLEIAQHRNC